MQNQNKNKTRKDEQEIKIIKDYQQYMQVTYNYKIDEEQANMELNRLSDFVLVCAGCSHQMQESQTVVQ